MPIWQMRKLRLRYGTAVAPWQSRNLSVCNLKSKLFGMTAVAIRNPSSEHRLEKKKKKIELIQQAKLKPIHFPNKFTSSFADM